MSRPLNQKRRLKKTLQKEVKKKRRSMPPPTIKHKDKRKRRRQEVKKDLKKYSFDKKVAQELMKIAKELNSDFAGGKWKNRRNKPKGKLDKFKHFMKEKVWHGPILDPEHPDSEGDSKLKKRWKTGPKGGKYWEDSKGNKHYANLENREVVKELVRIAKEVMSQDSAYKNKLPSLKQQRPVIFKALKGMIDVPGRGARRVYENYMTFSKGTSNKFHYFAIYKINPKERGGEPEYVGANAYGRIGGSPRGIEIARGPDLKRVKNEVARKENKKRSKGYMSDRHASIIEARKQTNKIGIG